MSRTAEPVSNGEREKSYFSCLADHKEDQQPYPVIHEPRTGMRRTETCVAPRYVDASRGALLTTCCFRFLSSVLYCTVLYCNTVAWGGKGERCQTLIFSLCLLFPSEQQTSSHFHFHQAISGIGHRVH